MSALESSLADSGQSDHARIAAAARLLKEAACILESTHLLAIRARLQEVIDGLEKRLSGLTERDLSS
jgi:hypothetical protein